MSYTFVAQSNQGFVFNKWSPMGNTNDSLEIELSDSTEIVAYFLPLDQSFPIQVTEVYTNNREGYDSEDWIEFYYYGSDTLNLDQWSITGKNDQVLYTFDQHSKIGPGEYFIVAEDLEQFRKVFPVPIQGFGDLDQGLSNNPGFYLTSGTGTIMKMVELKSAGDWPVRPAEGYSLELKSIINNTDLGMNWEISENTYGSPGLPNHTAYSFQQPAGKDTTLSNSQNTVLSFLSSPDFYSDPDNHSLAGISVKSIEGPGRIYSNYNQVSSGNIYEPSDFIFQTDKPYYVATLLQYSFIDQSGQESSDYSINFLNATSITPDSQEGFRLYPIPAQHECYFEIPASHLGPIDFYLFDLNGKILQHRNMIQTDKILSIDLSDISNGMYIYMLKTPLTVRNGKIDVIK